MGEHEETPGLWRSVAGTGAGAAAVQTRMEVFSSRTELPNHPVSPLLDTGPK